MMYGDRAAGDSWAHYIIQIGGPTHTHTHPPTLLGGEGGWGAHPPTYPSGGGGSSYTYPSGGGGAHPPTYPSGGGRTSTYLPFWGGVVLVLDMNLPTLFWADRHSHLPRSCPSGGQGKGCILPSLHPE